MADNELEIAIRLLADTHGADKVNAVLAKVRDETKKFSVEQADLSKTTSELTANVGKADAATQKYNLSKRQLKDLAQGLKHEFPLLGTALKFFTNPLTVSIGLLSACVAGFIKMRQHAIALAKDVDFTPMAEGLKGIVDASSIANDSLESLAETMGALNRIQREAEGQFRTNVEIIKAQAAAADELAAALGDSPEAKAARDKGTRDRLLEEDRKLLDQKKRENDAIIDERTAAEKELLNAEQAKRNADNKLKDINDNIAAIEDKRKKLGTIRPDEQKALFELRGFQTAAEMDAAAAGDRFTRAGGRVSTATGRIGASDREIAALRSSINSRSSVNAAGDEASGRASAIGGAVDSFFTGGGGMGYTMSGKAPAGMMAEFNEAVRQAAESKILLEELMQLFMEIFKDGIVTPAELKRLRDRIKSADQKPTGIG